MGNPHSTGINTSLPRGSIDLLWSWLSTCASAPLHCLSFVPAVFNSRLFFFFFLLVLRKISAAGGRQPEGEEELALDARYGERCGFPERSSKGLLRVLRAFLILSKVQHFLRKELILTDIKGHQHTDMCEHVLRPAAQHGSPEPQPSLPPLPPCQSQGCFSCSTVLLAAVNLYCLT